MCRVNLNDGRERLEPPAPFIRLNSRRGKLFRGLLKKEMARRQFVNLYYSGSDDLSDNEISEAWQTAFKRAMG